MKLFFKKWLEIDQLENRIKIVEQENRETNKILKIVGNELLFDVLGDAQQGGVKEHLWALMRYLNVLPYIELRKDEFYVPPEVPRVRHLKVDKRENVESQIKYVDSG